MKKKGSVFIAVGIVMILGAFLLTGYNILDGLRAERAAKAEAEALRAQLQEAAADSLDNFTVDETPIYVRYPDMAMPEIEIDGEKYVGMLTIGSLGLELPVKGEFSMAGLRTAPCRYTGSVYKDNMIICGHNYRSHFGNLNSLKVGDSVEFTDGDGNVFSYLVSEITQLDGSDVSGMTEKQEDDSWDLTLFTCTLSGSQRVTVRLIRIEQ
ncbi:MAG: sortase [Clostridiales bacterium]|nr:sortase [Clostridiales bacterium]